MNIIDWVVLGLIMLYVLNGVYRGFVPSLLNLGGFFVSWIASFLSYPLLSQKLAEIPLFSSLLFYIEGADRAGALFELTKLPVSALTPDQLQSVMSTASLPPPYDSAIYTNVSTQALADQGVVTLGEYFDATIFNVMINILSILIIFVILRTVFTLLTNAFSFSTPLPQLRRFDFLLGGATGFLRGFFSMYLIFSVIPIILVLLPISEVTKLINDSALCKVFYTSSILLRFVSGVI